MKRVAHERPDHGHQDEAEPRGRPPPQIQELSAPLPALGHPHHHHAARGAGDDVDERDLQAADGIEREGGGVEPPGDREVVHVRLQDLERHRQLQG
jgi:hypothetical protein